VSISSANCDALIAWPGAMGRIRRACSSKSRMNSRPVPSFVKLQPSFVNTVDPRAEQGTSHRRDQGDAVHQCDRRRRVDLSGSWAPPSRIGPPSLDDRFHAL
jgi:hypothetical protein